MSFENSFYSPLRTLRSYLLILYSHLMASLTGILSPILAKYASKKIHSMNLKIEGLPFPFPGQDDSSNKSNYSTEVVLKLNDCESLKRKAIIHSSLAAGEGYMESLWDCENLEELFYRFLKCRSKKTPKAHDILQRLGNFLAFKLMNTQSSQVGSKELANTHYDLGNDLYESFLDPWLQYTCGYWANCDNLNDAQVAKMELIALKLKLKPGMSVLDIGCGWGTLCKYLAEKHGVKCVGVSIGKEGINYGQKLCEGLPVDLRLMDYREVDEKFDRIVSVGMFEHVGHKNYETFFQVAQRCLVDDGIFLLHTIGVNHGAGFCTDPFVDKYIFPNSALPLHIHITQSTSGLFVIEDWHNFGPDYHKTLRAWLENFERNWPTISSQYGDKFFRMWKFYLEFSAALFRARKLQLWQIVLSKGGLEGGYKSIR